MGSGRGWRAGDWPSTGGGRSQHYCGGLDCGLLEWRSGNITRTRNVSENMLVLTLCLVTFSDGVVICLERGAYGPADVTATPSSLAPVKSRMVYLSGAGLSRLSWKKGR